MTTKPDWIKFKIPIFRVTVCTGIKNENSDYLIVLKIDIWKTEYCHLYWFSEHRFARTFQLHLSGLKSFFFFGDICAWIHVRVSHFVRVLFHLYVIHARFCVIGNSGKGRKILLPLTAIFSFPKAICHKPSVKSYLWVSQSFENQGLSYHFSFSMFQIMALIVFCIREASTHQKHSHGWKNMALHCLSLPMKELRNT